MLIYVEKLKHFVNFVIQVHSLGDSVHYDLLILVFTNYHLDILIQMSMVTLGVLTGGTPLSTNWPFFCINSPLHLFLEIIHYLPPLKKFPRMPLMVTNLFGSI
ncbi:hypothetical protein QTP88_014834 [Uroleucon formosanum]